jgi:hypothetical protein
MNTNCSSQFMRTYPRGKHIKSTSQWDWGVCGRPVCLWCLLLSLYVFSHMYSNFIFIINRLNISSRCLFCFLSPSFSLLSALQDAVLEVLEFEPVSDTNKLKYPNFKLRSHNIENRIFPRIAQNECIMGKHVSLPICFTVETVERISIKFVISFYFGSCWKIFAFLSYLSNKVLTYGAESFLRSWQLCSHSGICPICFLLYSNFKYNFVRILYFCILLHWNIIRVLFSVCNATHSLF